MARRRKKPETPVVRSAEVVRLDSLRPHPDNYREHPPEQVAHVAASMREHGVYRNIVVAADSTILAGHGVALAAAEAGLDEVPVVRLSIAPDSPAALRLLAGDNEVGRLAEADDRKLAEILRGILDEDVDGLLGTGFDEEKLVNLIYVTRNADEIERKTDAAFWAGLPEFEPEDDRLRIIVAFESEDDRDRFMALIGAKIVNKRTGKTWSIWWPEKENEWDRAKTQRWQGDGSE